MIFFISGLIERKNKMGGVFGQKYPDRKALPYYLIDFINII